MQFGVLPSSADSTKHWIEKTTSDRETCCEELRLVLRGKVTDHHRYMLRQLLGDMEHVEQKITQLEGEINRPNGGSPECDHPLDHDTRR
jgi:hypothetical protein